MRGFFSAVENIQRPVESLIPKCGTCGLYKDCESPKMPVSGEGRKGILFVAEAPGGDEDKANEQFVGLAGQLLRKRLELIGINIDRDCWKTNAVICRPWEVKEVNIKGTNQTEKRIANKPPEKKHIDSCRPTLFRTIKELNPRMIFLMGGVSVKSLLEPLWRGDTGGIMQWAGWRIPLQKYNAWVIPTYHPSFVRRKLDEDGGKVAQLWFDRQLKAANELKDRPWKEVPNYKEQIKLVYDAKEIDKTFAYWIKNGGAISFDYETNRLKPDTADAKIVCCAVCWRGKETIAYPWTKETANLTSSLLKTSIPKIGANCKFEDRWSRKILGHDVKNWVWDTMLSAHHLDNRPGITSVKFQALVRLGQEDWSSQIKPYLSNSDDKGVNRINEVDMRQLLTYCGMDALIEFKLAELQRKEMKNG